MESETSSSSSAADMPSVIDRTNLEEKAGIDETKLEEKERIDETNLELKAKIISDEMYDKYVAIAKILTDYSGEILEQRDIVFRSRIGVLKLRYLKPPARSQLIYYDRQDIYGPKLSKYNIIETDVPEIMEKVFTLTNGVLGVVEKTRNLFMFGRARIHLDEVKGLGKFIEFEVGLSPEETPRETREKFDKMVKAFKIQDQQLIRGSYMEEMLSM